MIFTFIPEADNDETYAFQQRVIGRGLSLKADGYTLELFSNGAPSFYVDTPDGKSTYIVHVDMETCNCKCAKRHGYCKHLVACTVELKRFQEEADDAVVAEMAWRAYEEAQAENPHTGVEPLRY